MSEPCSHPSRRLTRLQRRRLSWRVAQGASLAEAAARAGVPNGTVDELLGCADFAALVEDHRALAALGVEERERRLVEAALMVLEDAMRRDAPRAAIFILRQRLAGRSPSRALARGVMRALQRDVPEPSDDPPKSPPADPVERQPVSSVDQAAYAAAKELREELLDEAESIAGCVPAADAPQGAVWTEADLANVEDLASLLHEGLSERQLMMLADEHLRRCGLQVCDNASSPETEPKNPNAPNN